MNKERLILFTRYPVPGEVKSRLAASVGNDRACRIHNRLALHTWEMALAWGGDVEVRITGGTPADRQSWLNGARMVEQGDGTLGERMDRAVRAALDEGVQRLVLIGSDCPELGLQHVRRAFSELAVCDVVFGPAIDGGYYLLGVTNYYPELFSRINWGGPDVLAQSIALAPSSFLLDPLSDVDTVLDLPIMERSGLSVH